MMLASIVEREQARPQVKFEPQRRCRYDFSGKQYSINVVGNIWEREKFEDIITPYDKIDAYAIA